MDAVIEGMAMVQVTGRMRKIGTNGDGKSIVAIPNGRSRKKKKITITDIVVQWYVMCAT